MLVNATSNSYVKYREPQSMNWKYNSNSSWMLDGVLRHFQQYFSYIVAVSFIGG
jgi:hypothetical protein